MVTELVKQMIASGIHFGHRASRWNPKMKPYIFAKRNLIHIINVKETLKGLLLAKRFLTQVIGSGKDVLLVGTKRQARKSIEEHAARTNMHWVSERWLGGMLTNFREIRKRVGRLDELEQMETDGQLDTYSKKQGASLRREMRKIRRNLGGIRRMTSMPGALVVIDQRREMNSILEARKLKIPVICLLDTDSDPDMVDIPIPGNDDAMRSIELILRELCDTITDAIELRTAAEDTPPAAESRRRRSSRSAIVHATRTASPAEQVEPPAEAAVEAETAPPVVASPADAPAEAPADPPTDAPEQADQAEKTEQT